jgi:pimeloyl-ACP methyl ester carboxylesterase
MLKRSYCFRRDAQPVGLLLASLMLLAVCPSDVRATDERLTTRDGVQLAVTYLPGTKGKNTVPVVMLHAYKGDRRDYQRLAAHLQTLGHAVIVPDLRGHGASTHSTSGPPLTPGNVNFQAMAAYDMEAVVNFLVEKNNRQELNLDALCVVGAEMGAAVAVAWAAIDWSQPVGAPWGQDVKALVLLSPKVAFRNLRLNDALRNPAVSKDLSVLLLAGKDNARAAAEASRLHALFAAGRQEPARKEDRDLFFPRLDTALQSTDLLAEGKLGLAATIGEFIDLRLIALRIPWKARSAAK